MNTTRSYLLALATTLIVAAAWSAFAQNPGPPSVEVAKQALEKRWQKLKPDGISERNILFQEVRAGRPEGASYPFQVTVLIRDYEPGYPANHYYGNTCVARIEQGVYTLEPDQFGGWNAQGRMTPDSNERRCEKNPAAGVSSIPLSSLSGSPAQAAPLQNSQASQARPQTAQSAGGGGAVAQGSYECWSGSQANLMLNFAIQGGNRYLGYDGKPGTYSYDPATNRISFEGGPLDGVMPDGFHAIYHAPNGRPTVSYQNPQGREAAFCEKK